MKCFHTDPRFASALDLARQRAEAEQSDQADPRTKPGQPPLGKAKRPTQTQITTDLELHAVGAESK